MADQVKKAIESVMRVTEHIKVLHERRKELRAELVKIDGALAGFGSGTLGRHYTVVDARLNTATSRTYRAAMAPTEPKTLTVEERYLGRRRRKHPKFRGAELDHQIVQVLSNAPSFGMTTTQIRSALRPMRHEYVNRGAINNHLKILGKRGLVAIVSKDKPGGARGKHGRFWWKKVIQKLNTSGTTILPGDAVRAGN